MRTLTLVVPCFNEATRLEPDAFEAFARERPWLSLLFVDDGSSDDTVGVLEALAERLGPQGEVLVLPQNQGKAEAVRRGLLTAMDAGAECVGYWDADLATPLAELPEMMEILDLRPAVLVVMASRVRLLGRSIHRDERRHYAGRLFATVASALLGVAVYDTQCGAKLLRASPPVADALRQPFRSRWIFDVQLLARILSHVGPEALVEVPITSWRDVAGSKVRTRDFMLAALDLARMREDLGRARGRDQDAERLADNTRDTPSGRSR
jgi:glycosyltransferase involved in cell wall biosynthesis